MSALRNTRHFALFVEKSLSSSVDYYRRYLNDIESFDASAAQQLSNTLFSGSSADEIYFRRYLNDIGELLPDCCGINVLDYGAYNDGTNGAANYIAIKAALLAALNPTGGSGIGKHKKLYFPAGKYLITGDGVFNDASIYQDGFIIYGDGWDSTQLILNPNGVTTYFYNNPNVGTQQRSFVIWKDLRFGGDVVPASPQTGQTNFSNGFSFYQDQFHQFHRCMFYNLNSCINWLGNLNGDSWKFFGCKFTAIYGPVFKSVNDQNLFCELFGCNIESVYGDIFNYTAGGCIRMYGGSIIMFDSGSKKWLLNFYGAGQYSDTFLFSGIQTELHSTNTGLVYKSSSGGSGQVWFANCSLRTHLGNREWVNIVGCRVVFSECRLTEEGANTYNITGGAGAFDRWGDPGSIIFLNSVIRNDTASLVTISAGGYGYASARGCYDNLVDETDTSINRYAIDFDLNWQNQGRRSNFPGLKRISVKPTNRNWPYTDASWDWTVLLPANALIKNIYIWRKADVNGGAGSYKLFVGNGDKSTSYGDSGGGLVGTQEHLIVVEKSINALIAAGTTNPNNQVRIWANPTTAGVVYDGYFIVEYY